MAPNLSALIGEVVGARLISHAGSLTNLAKYPVRCCTAFSGSRFWGLGARMLRLCQRGRVILGV